MSCNISQLIWFKAHHIENFARNVDIWMFFLE
jgi:hypothetical protein